jgi:D-glycero-alpha-D-manno-heptose 1-phosphate guanylyltransferase
MRLRQKDYPKEDGMDNKIPDSIGVVILAGGLGSRLKGLYPEVPKPMIEVCGLPFLEWVIRYFSALGIRDFCISAGYKGNLIEKYIEQRKNDGLNLTVVQEESPQGTGGGFLTAATAMPDKDFLIVANGDSLLLADLRPILSRFNHNGTEVAIVGIEMEDCSRFGTLVCDNEGYLKYFREKQSGSGLINAGIYIFSSLVINDLPKSRPLSFEYDIFPLLIKTGKKIRVFTASGPFIDIGTPETISKASDFIIQNRSAWLLNKEESYDH